MALYKINEGKMKTIKHAVTEIDIEEIKRVVKIRQQISLAYDEIFNQILKAKKKSPKHYDLLRKENRLNKISKEFLDRHLSIILKNTLSAPDAGA